MTRQREPDPGLGYWVIRVPMRPGRDVFLLEAETILRRVVFERRPSPARDALLRLLEGCQHGYREEEASA